MTLISANGLLHAFIPAAFSELAMLGAPAPEKPIGAKAARKSRFVTILHRNPE